MQLAIVIEATEDNPDIGDLYLSQTGSTEIISDAGAELIQRLFVSFNFFLGEWHLNLNEGFPFYETIYGFPPTEQMIQAVFGQVILQEPQVASIAELTWTFDKQERALALSFKVVLQSGLVVNSADFPPFLITWA